ncbi:hypothetical protein KCP76_09595 [Salmonella enterica subsp. enterica serovar Weltevreden]|nr:hypothetical protein KCP76_09595 [Salmonella enterica subsp. enterica serovar Weltevreden]
MTTPLTPTFRPTLSPVCPKNLPTMRYATRRISPAKRVAISEVNGHFTGSPLSARTGEASTCCVTTSLKHGLDTTWKCASRPSPSPGQAPVSRTP